MFSMYGRCACERSLLFGVWAPGLNQLKSLFFFLSFYLSQCMCLLPLTNKETTLIILLKKKKLVSTVHIIWLRHGRIHFGTKNSAVTKKNANIFITQK